jgi:hypothetical protein
MLGGSNYIPDIYGAIIARRLSDCKRNKMSTLAAGPGVANRVDSRL